MSQEERDRRHRMVLLLAVAVAAVALLGYVAACGVALLASGSWPRAGVGEAGAGWWELASAGRWSHPRTAWEPRSPLRDAMPASATWWWLSAALVLGLIGGLVGVVLVRVDRWRGRARIDERRYDPRSWVRPRATARPRDLRRLREQRTDGWDLGRLDRRRLWSEREQNVALIAPTGGLKTSAFAVPWVLQADGPVVACSVKLDLFEASWQARREHGPVYVFAPFLEELGVLPMPGTGWTPLRGCEHWSVAIRRASAVSDATPKHDHPIAAFWDRQAADLLAPLMHAAALAGLSMRDVVRWVSQNDVGSAREILEAHGAGGALDLLGAVVALDDRNAGTTWLSTKGLLHGYVSPAMQYADRDEFSPERFVAEGGTLYLLADVEQQAATAPIFVALLAALFRALHEHHAATGAVVKRPVRFVLDEIANAAPIGALPQHLSTVRGVNGRVATIWQTLAQAYAAYGEHGANTILASSTVKLFGGPISDETTRRWVSELLDDEDRNDDDRRDRRKAGHQELQQLQKGQAVLVHGSELPAVVRFEHYKQRRDLPRPPALETTR